VGTGRERLNLGRVDRLKKLAGDPVKVTVKPLKVTVDGFKLV